MKYMGSKRLMLENGLGELLESQAKHSTRIFDPFCGSGAVAWFAAQRTGRKIIASDLQEYAAIIASAVVLRTSALRPEDIAADWFQKSRELLASWPAFDFSLEHSKTNPLPDAIHYVHSAREICESNGSRGCMWNAYGGHYYSPLQALKLDAMRETLPTEVPLRHTALASLLFAASNCAASPGHTAQPFQATSSAMPHLLTAWKKDPFEYCLKALYQICPLFSNVAGEAFVADVFDVVPELQETDLVFLDPPYSAVQYSRFYHVLETLARGSCNSVEGTGRYPPRSERPQSSFCLITQAATSLGDLLKGISEKGATVILTFPADKSSNGLSGGEVMRIASEYFKVEKQIIQSKFSTLGGNGSDAHRPARKASPELVLLLKP